jgi:hypothetical protein
MTTERNDEGTQRILQLLGLDKGTSLEDLATTVENLKRKADLLESDWPLTAEEAERKRQEEEDARVALTLQEEWNEEDEKAKAAEEKTPKGWELVGPGQRLLRSSDTPKSAGSSQHDSNTGDEDSNRLPRRRRGVTPTGKGTPRETTKKPLTPTERRKIAMEAKAKVAEITMRRETEKEQAQIARARNFAIERDKQRQEASRGSDQKHDEEQEIDEWMAQTKITNMLRSATPPPFTDGKRWKAADYTRIYHSMRNMARDAARKQQKISLKMLCAKEASIGIQGFDATRKCMENMIKEGTFIPKDNEESGHRTSGKRPIIDTGSEQSSQGEDKREAEMQDDISEISDMGMETYHEKDPPKSSTGRSMKNFPKEQPLLHTFAKEDQFNTEAMRHPTDIMTNRTDNPFLSIQATTIAPYGYMSALVNPRGRIQDVRITTRKEIDEIENEYDIKCKDRLILQTGKNESYKNRKARVNRILRKNTIKNLRRYCFEQEFLTTWANEGTETTRLYTWGIAEKTQSIHTGTRQFPQDDLRNSIAYKTGTAAIQAAGKSKFPDGFLRQWPKLLEPKWIAQIQEQQMWQLKNAFGLRVSPETWGVRVDFLTTTIGHFLKALETDIGRPQGKKGKEEATIKVKKTIETFETAKEYIDIALQIPFSEDDLRLAKAEGTYPIPMRPKVYNLILPEEEVGKQREKTAFVGGPSPQLINKNSVFYAQGTVPEKRDYDYETELSSPDGSIVTSDSDSESDQTMFEPEALTAAGITAEEAYGNTYTIISTRHIYTEGNTHEEDSDESHDEGEQLAERGNPFMYEVKDAMEEELQREVPEDSAVLLRAHRTTEGVRKLGNTSQQAPGEQNQTVRLYYEQYTA